ncbi:MAG: triose-phosphate isomerase family protein [Microgenomates group bacterium]
MKYLIANLKAHKSLNEMQNWLQTFSRDYRLHQDVIVGIAPSTAYLQIVQSVTSGLQNCCVVAQSVSNETQGSFTGEVTAQALKDVASYCIVGHSERRKRGETIDQIETQIKNLKDNNITPILCIRGIDDFLKGYTGFVAYEQPENIGTGHNTSAEQVMEVYKSLNLSSDSTFLYGASLDENNCKDYLIHPEIAGFLVGTASLDPEQFIKILENI